MRGAAAAAPAALLIALTAAALLTTPASAQVQVDCVYGTYNYTIDGCDCLPGWRGVNCTLCIPPAETNTSSATTGRGMESVSIRGGLIPFDPFCPEHSKCSTSLFPSYNTSHSLECRVSNAQAAKALDLEDGVIDLKCVTNGTTCQVWVWQHTWGGREIFGCNIWECGYEYRQNTLTLKCGRTNCTAGPAWTPSEVLASILDGMTGWMSFVCDLRNDACVMHQEQLQAIVVPLTCVSGDCVPESFHQPPVYVPPFWTKEHIIMAIGIAVAVAFLALLGVIRFLYVRSKASEASLLATAAAVGVDALATDQLDEYMFDLGFSDVSVTVGTKTILRDAAGYCAPGTVTAIMGPSGAGKTTLLHALAGKLTHSGVEGRILMNGRARGASFKRIAGFVTQDDFLIPTLTVRETLNFHARLRLGSSVTPAARVARVEKVIAQLELTHVADSRVGDRLIRGISGGERRRVSIATELVTAPRILFLDEPTSGLDSCTASAIMTTLRDLATTSALTIVLSIHQPRSSIFAAFDSLILLARGAMLYNGRAAAATAHFAQLGHHCPPDFNPADYLIDLVTASDTDVLDNLAHHYTTSPAASALYRVLDNYLASAISPPVPRRIAAMTSSTDASSLLDLLPGLPPAPAPAPAPVASTHARSSSAERRARTQSGRLIDAFVIGSDDDVDYDVPAAFEPDEPLVAPSRAHSSMPALSINGDADDEAAESAPGKLRVFFNGQVALAPYATSALRQTFILCQRTGLNVIRNPSLGLAHYAVTLVVAVIIGGIYFQVGDDWPGLQNRAGSIFFIVALLCFGSLSALDLFIGERAMFLHERSNGCYRSSTYFVSKLVCDMVPLRIIPPILLASITYFMIGLRPGAEHFVWMAFILVLVNVNATALCMAIGAIVPSMAVGNLLAVLIMLFFMLFGGLLLNASTIGPLFIWLKSISIFNYAYEAILVNQLEGTITYFETSPGVVVLLTGEAVLDKLSLSYSHFERDVIILVVMAIGYIVAAYAMLRVRIWLKR